MTGTAVKRSKKEVSWSKLGTNLGVLVFPSKIARIAIAELIPTKTTARRTDIAELNLRDSAVHNKAKILVIPLHSTGLVWFAEKQSQEELKYINFLSFGFLFLFFLILKLIIRKQTRPKIITEFNHI